MRHMIALMLSAVLLSGSVAEAQRLPAARAVVTPAAKIPLVTTPPPVPPVMYDFKGARLGMTLMEWRRLPPPVSSYQDPSKFAAQYECRRDLMGKDAEGYWGMFVTEDEKRVGIFGCGYVQRRREVRTYIPNVSEAYVEVGDGITNDVTYKFLDDKLYAIDITGSKTLFSGVIEGLTAKFGKPTQEVNDTTQNKAGAIFPHTVLIWANSAATIRVETPWTKIDNMNIRYATVEGIARVNAAREAAHPAASKM